MMRFTGNLCALLVAALASPWALAQTNEGVRPAAPERPAEVQASKLSKLPKQTKFVEAQYPKQAEEQGIEASVVLLIDINAEGQVDSVGIQEPADPPNMGFDEAALAAAQQFEFEPAEIDGKPVAVQINYRYRFTLKPKPKPVEPAPAAPAAPAEPQKAAEGAPPAEPTPAGVVNFRGVLLERGTRLPLSGVIVTVFQDNGDKPVGFEATSDAEGRFQFVDLPAGTWKVLVESPGYYPFRTSETVSQHELVDVTYHVERGSYNPYDVTITATRPKKEVSRTVLSAQEIERVPGGIGDPLTVVQNFAGVARTDNPGLLIVRGSAPEDSQIFIEGTMVPLVYHFGGLRSVVPAGMLDSIEFYPGNYGPQYGRLMGGIVDVRLKDLQPKKIGGYADVSILDTGVYLEAPIGDKLSVAVAGRRSYIDYLLNAAIPDSAPIDLVTAPRYYDYQLLANYRPSPQHDIRGIFFGSDDRFKLILKNPGELGTQVTRNDFGFSTTFYRGLLSYRYVPNQDFENTLKVSKGRDFIKFNIAQFFADMTFDTTQLREAARYRFDPHFAATVGADIVLSQADVELLIPQLASEGERGAEGGGISGFESSSTHVKGLLEWYPGLFAEGELTPGGGFLLLPGFRVDRYGMSDDWSFEPRLTGRWQFAKRFTAKGGVGLFQQEPQFLELYKTLGNPDLTPERAVHYSAGLEYKPLDFLTLDGTLFYKRLTNLVSPTDRLVTIDGEARPLRYDNNGSGHVWGLEFVTRHELAHGLSGWLAYTLSRSTRVDSGGTEERLFDYDQSHVLTLVASYALPRNWQIGTRFRWTTGMPTTPVVGAVYNASEDQYQPSYGEVNTARRPSFHQLDLRVDKRWVYQDWMFSAYLDIQNVYNSRNPTDHFYNYNFRQKRASQGMPLIPIIGMRAEF
jgi:TonB family protein